jgi:hypothetical protein
VVRLPTRPFHRVGSRSPPRRAVQAPLRHRAAHQPGQTPRRRLLRPHGIHIEWKTS